MSNLAQLQQGNSSGGGGQGNLVQLAAVAQTERPSGGRVLASAASKRDSFQQAKQESTEKLLMEKDEEIRKMQAMIQQMASQLSHAQSGPNSIDDSTTV